MQQALKNMNSNNNQSTQINISESYPDLTLFGIWQYSDGGVNHYDINETVHKSNLPLTILTYQEGYGDITGIWIDNVPLYRVYLSNKEVADSNYTINQCCFRAICLEDEIRNLDNGIHFITIQCTGLNDIQSATFSFNLTD